MTTSTRPRKTEKKRGSAIAPMPWWGDRGPAPHLRWPGVTIEIPATWSKKNQRWESPDGKFYFDMQAADDAVRFFPELLTHHIGEFKDQPFELMEYQKKLLTRPIFGWKYVSTGYRRYRKVFAFLPKGAGKSPWGAGTGLYMTLLDNEPAAEVYAVAADKEQARTVHENAKIMVEESPDLLEECEVLKDSIYHAGSRSTYKVLSSDASTKHGFRPHCVIFDEMHAQKNRDLYEALKKSMIKRRQPLMIIISHAGDDDEGICFEEYEYAKSVLSGTIPDHSCLPVIFEMTPDDDWTSPEVWKRVNPGHGITVKHEGIEQECREAIAEPRKRNDFLRFHGNRWTNQSVSWLPVEWWDACPGTLPADDILRGLNCAAGLDMAQKIDLAAFPLVFKEPLDISEQVEVLSETEQGDLEKKILSLNYRVHVLPHFWIPENTMKQREQEDKVPYSLWRDKGFLVATPGDIIDYDRIYKDILKLAERFPLLKQGEIGYDPAFATDIAMKLQGAGLKMVQVLQNYKYMSEPCQVLEALLKAKRVTHNSNRCMRWNVENVAIKTDDAGRIHPAKSRKSTKRIDGVVGTVMAIGRLMFEPEESIYTSRGLLYV